MNRNQTEFSEYWDRVANAAFYKVIEITENKNFTDKILDRQRAELSGWIKKEIDRTFFEAKMRPETTVWMENLKKEYPDVADRFEKYIKNVEIVSKGDENLLVIAAGGASALTGAALRKKKPGASALLMLTGAAAAGSRIVSGLSVDTGTLQKEVKKQFEVWRTALLDILAACDDGDFDQDENEQD